MSFIDRFHFIRPAWLVLAPVAIWIWWLWRRSQDPLRSWRAVMDQELLNAMTVGNDSRGNWNGTGLLVGWILAVVAVAGPTWRPEPSPFADDPVPVMLVLKAGESMDLTDIAPSRMERARLKVADFAAERKGQPLGLVAYAGSAHLVLPPTRDTAVVATMAADMDPAIMPKPGDELAEALDLAARTLASGGGSIVVLADTVRGGGDNGLAQFHANIHPSIHILAIARRDTPEWDSIKQAAATVNASVTLMTPDREDIRVLVKNTAKAPVEVADAGEGTRWEESGWWLVPPLALLLLLSFRRVGASEIPEATP